MNIFRKIFGSSKQLTEENAALKQQLINAKIKNQELIDITNSYWKTKVHELNNRLKEPQKQK